MQMLQFVLVFLHSIQTLYYDCNYPRVVAKVRYFVCSKILVNEKLFFKLMIINMVIFFILFGNYYFYTYITKKKESRVWTIQKLHRD